MPSGQEVLIATVDGTLGVIAVPPPSGGLPAGNGFQVNFVKDPQDLNTILAQSQQFAITQSNSTTTTSLSNTAVLYVFFSVAWRLLLTRAYPFCTARQQPPPILHRPRTQAF